MKYIAYCGLVCSECPVFIATLNNDRETLARLAAEYSNEFCSFTPEELACNGCFDRAGNSKMCGECPVLNCAKEKHVENCGHCGQYPCQLIEQSVTAGCESRLRLDRISSETHS